MFFSSCNDSVHKSSTGTFKDRINFPDRHLDFQVGILYSRKYTAADVYVAVLSISTIGPCAYLWSSKVAG